MSESASTNDKSTVDQNVSQAYQLEKKKTKVLKGALKEERKQRSTIEEELKSANERIATLSQQMADKVSVW